MRCILFSAPCFSSISNPPPPLQFEKKAAFISEQLEEVNAQFTKATVTMTADNREEALDNALKTIMFLKKLTPHAVGAARSLASEKKRKHSVG